MLFLDSTCYEYGVNYHEIRGQFRRPQIRTYLTFFKWLKFILPVVHCYQNHANQTLRPVKGGIIRVLQYKNLCRFLYLWLLQPVMCYVVSELEMITIKRLYISYVIENYLSASLQNLSHVQLFRHKN